MADGFYYEFKAPKDVTSIFNTALGKYIPEFIESCITSYFITGDRKFGGNFTWFLKRHASPISLTQIAVDFEYNGHDAIIDGIQFSAEQVAKGLLADYIRTQLELRFAATLAAYGVGVVAGGATFSGIIVGATIDAAVSMGWDALGISDAIKYYTGTEPVFIEMLRADGNVLRGVSFASGLPRNAELGEAKKLFARSFANGGAPQIGDVAIVRRGKRDSEATYIVKRQDAIEYIAKALSVTPVSVNTNDAVNG